jgi:subtilisin family serine protease
MKLRSVSLAVLTLLGGFSGAALAQSRSTYIVQLAAEPAATYAGNVAGYAATAAEPGTRYNARTPAALAYAQYLDTQQLSVASLVAGAPILARYNTVFNGFAASLTAAEVQALRASPKVVEVFADEARKLETVTTSTFLGLNAANGVWNKLVNGLAVKGENVIIGVVDSGVWPNNPTFADRANEGTPVFTGGVLAYGPAPAGWLGGCQSGEGFDPAIHCNNKLVGAKFFNAGFKAARPADGTKAKHWTEFYSPRDSVAGPTGHGGHGTHTASTSGGNASTPVVVGGINMGTASGMAPRARIAAYKVCYTFVEPAATDGTGTQNTCYTSDSVSAIDAAVADGVHVINYSISGSQISVNDPVEQAFLRAANAGVFVAASAGNSGPSNAVAHVSPWLTTVAASTHDRALKGTVTLGNGASYTGASINPTAIAGKPMIRAQDAGVAGADATSLRLCFSNPVVLDPAKIAGKVVVCDRGTNARVDKSTAVKNGGGVGMVLVDNGAGLVADVHAVPTVHVSAADGAIIKAYAATGGSMASIGVFFYGTTPAPIMASFSSRGPNQGDSNMLKPDITAPGVDVIAGVTANLTEAERNSVAAGTLVPGADWASYQGTSMSSPHIAGLAALLRQANPGWSPMAIKSALMTTATTTLTDGLAGVQNGLLPWAQGAGHVAPNSAIDPGLVYDATKTDFIRYQCKANRAAVVPAADCTTFGTLDQTYNHNLPSITVGNVSGATTVTRRVTNVGGSAATYTSAASLPGFAVVVTPASLSLAAGETKSFTVRLTPTTAVEGVWAYGALVWNDGTHNVRSPLTARSGKTIVAPSALTGTTTAGVRLHTINTAFAGRMSADKGGMKPATMGPVVSLAPTPLSSAQLKTACTTGTDTAGVKVYPVTIAADTIVARFALRQSDTSTADDDHDMGLLAPNGTWVYSGNDGSGEAVEMLAPAAGAYKVCVVGYGNGGAATMTHKLSSWVVTPADAGTTLNVLVPGNAVANGTATIGVSWNNLATNERYVGGFRLKDVAGAPQTATVVRVDTTGTPPLAQPEHAVSTRKLAQ